MNEIDHQPLRFSKTQDHQDIVRVLLSSQASFLDHIWDATVSMWNARKNDVAYKGLELGLS
jgi:hypothetical protein